MPPHHSCRASIEIPPTESPSESAEPPQSPVWYANAGCSCRGEGARVEGAAMAGRDMPRLCALWPFDAATLTNQEAGLGGRGRSQLCLLLCFGGWARAAKCECQLLLTALISIYSPPGLIGLVDQKRRQLAKAPRPK